MTHPCQSNLLLCWFECQVESPAFALAWMAKKPPPCPPMPLPVATTRIVATCWRIALRLCCTPLRGVVPPSAWAMIQLKQLKASRRSRSLARLEEKIICPTGEKFHCAPLGIEFLQEGRAPSVSVLRTRTLLRALQLLKLLSSNPQKLRMKLHSLAVFLLVALALFAWALISVHTSVALATCEVTVKLLCVTGKYGFCTRLRVLALFLHFVSIAYDCLRCLGEWILSSRALGHSGTNHEAGRPFDFFCHGEFR